MITKKEAGPTRQPPLYVDYQMAPPWSGPMKSISRQPPPLSLNRQHARAGATWLVQSSCTALLSTACGGCSVRVAWLPLGIFLRRRLVVRTPSMHGQSTTSCSSWQANTIAQFSFAREHYPQALLHDRRCSRQLCPLPDFQSAAGQLYRAKPPVADLPYDQSTTGHHWTEDATTTWQPRYPPSSYFQISTWSQCSTNPRSSMPPWFAELHTLEAKRTRLPLGSRTLPPSRNHRHQHQRSPSARRTHSQDRRRGLNQCCPPSPRNETNKATTWHLRLPRLRGAILKQAPSSKWQTSMRRLRNHRLACPRRAHCQAHDGGAVRSAALYVLRANQARPPLGSRASRPPIALYRQSSCPRSPSRLHPIKRVAIGQDVQLVSADAA